MSDERITRRDFFKRAIATGMAAYGLGALLPRMGWEEEAEAAGRAAARGGPEEPRPGGRGPCAAVNGVGGMGRFVKRGARVVVKPNMGWARTAEQAANTNPQIVAEVVKMCREAGAGGQSHRPSGGRSRRGAAALRRRRSREGGRRACADGRYYLRDVLSGIHSSRQGAEDGRGLVGRAAGRRAHQPSHRESSCCDQAHPGREESDGSGVGPGRLARQRQPGSMHRRSYDGREAAAYHSGCLAHAAYEWPEGAGPHQGSAHGCGEHGPRPVGRLRRDAAFPPAGGDPIISASCTKWAWGRST